MKPQTADVLSYLKRGRSLTALEALDRLGCARLAARVDELRGAGYEIRTQYVRQDGKRFARYRLAS